MSEIRAKSTLQIISLCTGFLGIQIGFALQAGNVTRILQNFGADLSHVPLFWLIAPLSGAIIQPLIGLWSDRDLKNGKTRIPYLLTGGVICSAALLFLPHANALISWSSPLMIGGLLLIVIDISFNISMHPLRASISDYLLPHQQAKGFAIQSSLISIGAIIGSTLPYILAQYFHIDNIAAKNEIAANVKVAFHLGSCTLLLCILITAYSIYRSKAKRPVQLQANFKKISISEIPAGIWKIGLVQFFSWGGFFLIWIYMTPAIAGHIFQEYQYVSSSQAYSKAANYTGLLFGTYHLASFFFSLLLPYLYQRFHIKKTHTVSLFIGAISMLSMYFIKDITSLYIPMIGLGIAWASILSSPYSLLIKILPKNQVGLYLGVFNLFITLPQIFIGLSSGFLLKSLHENQAIYAIIYAGGFLMLGAVCNLFTKQN